MNSIEKIRDDVIKMQQWASQDPKENERLLTLLSQVRGEVERKWLRSEQK